MFDSFIEEEKPKRNSKALLYGNILHDTKSDFYDFIVITHFNKYDEIKRLIQYLNTAIKQKLGFSRNLQYKIIYPLKHYVSSIKMNGDLKSLIPDSLIDFNKFIPVNSKILALDHSCQFLTKNSDIRVSAFEDFIFNDTWFYHPKLKSLVFPAYSLRWDGEMLQDTFENKFFLKQIDKMFKEDLKIKRQIKLDTIDLNGKDKVKQFLQDNLSDTSEWAVDIETSGLNFQSDSIECVSLACTETTGYYLRWRDIDLNLFYRFLINKKLVLANGKFDFLFFWQALKKNHDIFKLKIYFDTWQAGHHLNELRSNSLKTHSWLYTTYGGYEESLDNFKRKYPNAKYSEIPEHLIKDYATMDAIVTFQVFKKMEKQIDTINFKYYGEKYDWGFKKFFYEMVIPTWNNTIKMEFRGVLLNWDYVKENMVNIHSKMLNLMKAIAESFGIPYQEDSTLIDTYDITLDEKINFDINLQSGKQLSAILKEKGWKNYEATKTGDFKINEDTLEKWINDGHEEAKLIKDLHAISTIHKTYIGYSSNKSGYFQYQYPDGKIHPRFFPFLADSRRWRHGSPNIANLPKHGEYSRLIRRYFEPDSEDFLICEVDAAGFQLRICAAFCQDEAMKKIFGPGGLSDMHSVTGAGVFTPKITVEEFLKLKKEGDSKINDYRQKSKSVNFSLLFGTTAIKLAMNSLLPEWSASDFNDYLIDNNLLEKYTQAYTDPSNRIDNFNTGWSRDLLYKAWICAIDIKKKFFETYPAIKERLEENIKFACEKGYILTPLGAIRRLPRLYLMGDDDSSKRIKNFKNIAVNTDIQAFEAFRISKVINGLFDFVEKNNLKSYVWGMVHDSICLMLHREEKEIIINKAKELFETPCPEDNGIQMLLDVEIKDYFKGQYWGIKG
ncbi:MAG: hypothetical protein GF311_28170 [Candidatus Lokiarchaeota archaeon]|nr:hypothetical protein [Candidatus Lokiarchaeota archaeon]